MTHVFSVINDPILSANALNNDLSKIQEWAYQWRMSFNPDLSKQAQEVLFSRKRLQINHPDLHFNGSVVQKTTTQKHLGVILDEKLTFKDHLNHIFDKTTNRIGMLRKLCFLVPRQSLLTI